MKKKGDKNSLLISNLTGRNKSAHEEDRDGVDAGRVLGPALQHRRLPIGCQHHGQVPGDDTIEGKDQISTHCELVHCQLLLMFLA